MNDLNTGIVKFESLKLLKCSGEKNGFFYLSFLFLTSYKTTGGKDRLGDEKTTKLPVGNPKR